MSISMSSNFSPEIVSAIFSTVKGHSSLVKLSGRVPVKFSGTDIFVFSLDDEVNIVAEGGQKTEGASASAPVKMTPIKVEYGARVTDEFMYASEERKLDILSAFIDGYGKKISRGLDIMAFHGLNPRNKSVAASIGTKCFDRDTGVSAITYVSGSELAALNTAIAAIGDNDNTGFALSKGFAAALSQVTIGNSTPFAGFMFGGNPGSLNGIAADVNSTVSFTGSASGSPTDQAIVGDFANAFKWGYAKEIPFEIIPYGDPDGNGDLKRTNQIFIRAEAWIGWAILDPTAFARIA